MVGLTPEQQVEADIRVLQVNALIDRGTASSALFGPYSFGGGVAFSFRHNYANSVGNGLTVWPVGSGLLSFAGFSAAFNSLNYFYAANLQFGQAVSQTAFLPNGYYGLMAWAPGYPNSQFLEPGTGYLGFRFDVGNGTQYGYAEVFVDGEPQNTATLVKYAWVDPGESIRAGQIPEPNAMGVLALGALGITAWRRSRKSEK